ncbi:putative pth2 family peptidyl-trna hydrolase [Phaeomoniella chlamydospora]|uniref:Putative pth2 family peptidyl-trna hydrolase n=1 Tax=Phaeomoniella chlamydospora TaxID=158046 RepID=A0A0G2EH33_PHACM|nr:putative pth2 family peptidyl-trna hydrolase [Phaeomoniella chlamydospora]
MRFTTLLLAIPALAVAAQDQVPLKDKAAGWFNKAKAYVPAAAPNPIDAGASQVAAKRKSVPILSAISNSPNFGIIDCERQGLLCTTWGAGVPSLYLFQIPVAAPDQTQQVTPLYIKPLNTTSVNTAEIVKFYAEQEYLTKTVDEKTGTETEKYRYDGIYHPINGQLKVFGLLHPVGYLIYGFSQIPSFVIMILISFVSRNIMGRRAANPRPRGPAPAAAAAQ